MANCWGGSVVWFRESLSLQRRPMRLVFRLQDVYIFFSAGWHQNCTVVTTYSAIYKCIYVYQRSHAHRCPQSTTLVTLLLLKLILCTWVKNSARPLRVYTALCSVLNPLALFDMSRFDATLLARRKIPKPSYRHAAPAGFVLPPFCVTWLPYIVIPVLGHTLIIWPTRTAKRWLTPKYST